MTKAPCAGLFVPYLFIDWVLALPAALKDRYHQQIEQFEEEHQTESITGIEQRGIEKGRREGERTALLSLLEE